MNSDIKELSKHFFTSFIDWVFRRRSFTWYVMSIGLTCTLASSVGPSMLDVVVSILYEIGLIDFDSIELSLPPAMKYTVLGIGISFLFAGFLLEMYCRHEQRRRISRKRVLVIEVRGLRDAVGNALIDSIPKKYQGQRDQLLIDLCQRVVDGEISDPIATLKELTALPISVKQRSQSLDRTDLTVVYGGLAPVPLVFLSGVLIDDEQDVVLFDWDRHTRRWRELNESDDEKRFKYGDIDEFTSYSTEVALAVSVSYPIKEQDIRAKLGDIPIISMTLEEGLVDSHWSDEKQRALGSQFLNTLISLEKQDITKIHLFLAAPCSIAFRFGQLYDKRNLPSVIVYQYQRAISIKYPWGILMPVSGITEPSVVK